MHCIVDIINILGVAGIPMQMLQQPQRLCSMEGPIVLDRYSTPTVHCVVDAIGNTGSGVNSDTNAATTKVMQRVNVRIKERHGRKEVE